MTNITYLITRLENADNSKLSSDDVDDLTRVLFPGFNLEQWGLVKDAVSGGSVDAALALVRRVLHTYSITMTDDPSGNGCEIFYWPKGLANGKQVKFESVSTRLPLAICIALLKAKQEIDNGNE